MAYYNSIYWHTQYRAPWCHIRPFRASFRLQSAMDGLFSPAHRPAGIVAEWQLVRTPAPAQRRPGVPADRRPVESPDLDVAPQVEGSAADRGDCGRNLRTLFGAAVVPNEMQRPARTTEDRRDDLLRGGGGRIHPGPA